MNSDSTATAPYLYDWSGIVFNDVSLDPLCKVSNSFIRYAYNGISTTNASPDIQKTSFNNIYLDAVTSSGSSNPTINFCDFYNTSASFGVNNVNQSFVINAENNWWAKNTGPTHSGNPTGTGSKSSNAVDYLPFKTNGPNVPIAGDVSQNGMVQAFDAAQILQFLVGSVSLSSTQQTVGDVSGNNSLSAMDASYILQYAVGLINGFPSEAYNRNLDETDASFSVAHQSGLKGNTVIVPLSLSNVNNLYGSFARIKYDTTYLELDTLAFENTGMNAAYNSPVAGTLLISMAGTTALNNDLILANLHLKIKNNAPAGLTIPLVVEAYQGNELDLTASAKSGSVKVLGKSVPLNTNQQSSIVLSPNPAVNHLVITIKNNQLPNPFMMYVTDMAGKKLIQKSLPLLNNNGEAVSIKLNTTMLASGMYILSIQSESGIISQKFIIAR
ncbi:MAG TPA: T9SS type A sorting domain-containing protein [Ferruginibacter sp.]|nr:T9SS type A sorting domain-containing protein [Ferruginibacter sp.]